MIIRMLVVWAVFGWAVSGCTLKASTDTSTDGTTEFVSSTTGKTWWTEEGLVKQGQHARVFVALNYDNLLQDIAKGEGEYLLAFAETLQVPAVHQLAFAHQLQQHYVDLSGQRIHEGGVHVKQFLYQVIRVMANLPSPYRTKPFSS